MKQEYEDLLQRRVDGCLDASELERLRTVLETNPAARRTSEELERLAGMLDGVEDVDPPPGLRSDILASIARIPRGETPVLRRLLAGLGIEGRGWFPRAAVLAGAAAAAGLLILTFLPGEYVAPDGKNLTGTLAPSSAARPLTGEVEIDEGWLGGRIELKGTATQPVVSIETTSADELRVVVSYDPGLLRFAVVRGRDGEIERFGQAAGELSWLAHGDTRCELAFERLAVGQTDLTFRFFGSGEDRRVTVPLPEPIDEKK